MHLPLLEHHCEHSADQGGSHRSKILGYLSTIAAITVARAILDIFLVSGMQNIRFSGQISFWH